MKIFSQTYIFNYPFSTISSAVWRKYPNELKPEVLSTDVVERRITDNGNLESERIIKTKFPLPGLVAKILGAEEITYGYEKSIVDLNKQEMTQLSENITFSERLALKEHLTYTAYGPNQTILKQETRVELHSLPAIFQYIKNYGENWIISDVEKNIEKGRSALEWVVQLINREKEANTIPDPKNGMKSLSVVPMDGEVDTSNGIVEVTAKALKSVDQFGNNVIKSVSDSVSDFDIKKSVSDFDLKKSVSEFEKTVSEFDLKKSVSEIEKTVSEFDLKKTVNDFDLKKTVDDIENILVIVENVGEKAKKSVDESIELNLKSKFKSSFQFEDMFYIS